MYYCLEDKGISIVIYIVQDERMAYSSLKDFRNKEGLSCQTVSRNLKYIEQTDATTVIAAHPSYGTTIEMVVSKKSGGKTILLARDPVPTL
jgi:hypothetical protein